MGGNLPDYGHMCWKGIRLTEYATVIPFLALMLGDSKGLAQALCERDGVVKRRALSRVVCFNLKISASVIRVFPTRDYDFYGGWFID